MSVGMRVGVAMVGLVGFLMSQAGGAAAEHGGKEHGGASHEHGGQAATTEHGGQTATAEPSAEQIRQAIQDYVQEIVKEEGEFTIDDEEAGGPRRLELIRVHERVGKTGELYYACTDMRDLATAELLDLDFDVEAQDEALDVVDVRIHKVNDAPRYTYDAQDQRVPVVP